MDEDSKAPEGAEPQPPPSGGDDIRQAVSSVLKKRMTKSADERRTEILDAALSLFSDKGFNETTMEAVALKAGVAKGTIYLYFKTKEHVLLALKRQFTEGLHAACAAAIAEVIERLDTGGALDRRMVIDSIVDAMVAYNVDHRDAVRVVVRQNPGPDLMAEALELEAEFLELLARAFRTGSESGFVHVSDPEMAAYLFNAAMRDNIVTCLCYGRPDDLDRLVAAIKEMLNKSLAPSEPRA